MSRLYLSASIPALVATLVAAPAAAQVGTGSAPVAAPSGPPVASAVASSAPRVVVQPYIEASQTLNWDLNSGDAVTYTQLSAGIDASIATNRVQGQVSYRYDHLFAYEGEGDYDVHTGLARASVALVRGLTLEGGALATRARADIRGDAPENLLGPVGNTSQVYSAYIGPNLSTNVGPVGVNAFYQAGYTKVETPTTTGIGPDARRLDYYDDSWGHAVGASVGTQPNTLLPIGVTVSGLYTRETAGQLSQRYEGWFGRGDVLVPISPTVAVAAGVGYEKIETSQKDPLFTSPGAPAFDEDGRFITDPNSPRRISYRTDGVYYDAGVVWRPNRRTELRASVGKRYGSTSYTGTLTYQASPSVGFGVAVYDTVTTFGRQLRTGLAQLPTSFRTQRDPFGQAFGGCTFGTTGAAPGGCLDDVFQSITTASYRARGIEGVVSAQRGRATYGAGLGYANRRLHAPGGGSGIVIYGQEDESYYGQLFYARTLTEVSGFDANLYANYYDSELPGSDGVWSGGGQASYYHQFGRLQTTAAVGLYAFKVGDFSTDWAAQALLGARYTF